MRLHNPSQSGQKTREHGAHPVPRKADSFVHIASFYASQGDRSLPGGSGAVIAEELTRNLLPKARKAVIG
jgi:hypothetical protein